MSCSLIEAKFQVLDATIKLLNTTKHRRAPKVASSEQLRELVASQTPTSLLPTSTAPSSATPAWSNRIGSARSARSSVAPFERSRGRERVSNGKYSDLRRTGSRPTTGRESHESSSADVQPAAWVDPKQQRAQQLLQDTWGEIEAAVSWGTANVVPAAPGTKALHSRLLAERDDAPEDTPGQQSEGNQAQDQRDSLVPAIHNALPAPKRPLRLTSSFLKDAMLGRPGSERKTVVGRCRSAGPAVVSNPDLRPRNWFAPSNVSKDGVAARGQSKLPKVKKPGANGQRPVSSTAATKRSARRQNGSSSARAELSTTTNEKPEVVEDAEPEAISRLPKIDDPAFYRLEVRLDHPGLLTAWRFQALFTDMSVCPTKAVVLEDLTVDDGNHLLFHSRDALSEAATLRYFDPLAHFPGISRPSDLYGHVLRIIVTSSHPVSRIVVNTCVQFTVTPDEAAVLPPGELERFPAAANSDTGLQGMLTRRNSSTASRKKQKAKVRGKSALSRDDCAGNNISTSSLAMDPAFECSPWASGEQDDRVEDAVSLEAQQTPSLQPLQLTDERCETQAAGTIDRKKIQLQRLRASMRREMREEKQQELQARQEQDDM